MKNATCNSHHADLRSSDLRVMERRRGNISDMTFLCFCFDFKMNKINQSCVYNIKTFFFFFPNISIKIKVIESSTGCGFDDSLLKHLGFKVKAGVQEAGVDDDAALGTRKCDLLHRK